MLSGIIGERVTGKELRAANATAIQAVANVLKSSLGPQGLDKMLVDEVGDVTVTNDGATILKQLEVQHPAAKVLVEVSELQDKEVGDGTTSVVLLASELLKRANNLLAYDIHPTNIISGYKLALKESVKYIKSNLSQDLDKLSKDVLYQIAKTSLSSKYIGFDSEHFANLVVQSILSVKQVSFHIFKTSDGEKVKYPVSAVNVLTAQGKSSKESFLVDGYAIKMTRAAQGMPMVVNNAKIALLDFALKQYRMQLGVQLNISNPEELEKMRLKEKDITKEQINKIISAGANVVLTTQGIDDMALKYFVEAGIIALRRVTKKDLKRIAKCTGGTIALTMVNIDGEEKFDPSMLGHCASVYEERLGDWDYIFFKGTKTTKSSTVVLRGANDFMVEEAERSFHDSICSVSTALEFNSVVPGGGCVETALSIYLEDFARTLGSREQLAIAEFASALLVIPKTLAVNAALDATELVAQLRAYHAKSQFVQETSPDRRLKWYGLDLFGGKVRDNLAAGVLEPAINKIKAIKFATEAAITILRIDDLIKIKPEEQNVEPE